MSFFSWFHPFCVKMCVCTRAMACQPASLPATSPAPEPAGTFALWLQFPGMPNLRQLLRTCYLCQQCAGSAHHISCRSVSIWVCDWICVCICLSAAYCIFNSSHICICARICMHGRTHSLSHVCSAHGADVDAWVVCTVCVCMCQPWCVCMCVSICVCWASLACIWSSIGEAFQQACQTAQMLVL